MPWFENANEINKKCKKIESNIKESPDVANSEFKDVIHNFIIMKNSFLEKWTKFWKINNPNIRKIRRENIKIIGIFPDEIIETESEYRDYANKAYVTYKTLDEFPIILKKYSELWPF